jgi:CDP-2,3-bis-(O-geranylgeranyl)-sn-glycerol synthase
MVFTVFNLVEAIWLILPAFAANGLAPLVGLMNGLHPIDGGRKLGKRRLLGNGKTWEGLVFGSLVGMAIGAVEMLANPYLPWGLSEVPLTIVPMTPLLGLVLGFGSMAGDVAGSFLKRRMGRERGAPFPLLDQLDFLAGALIAASLLITIKLEWILLLAVLTPVLHLTANVIGYRIGVKKTPW